MYAGAALLMVTLAPEINQTKEIDMQPPMKFDEPMGDWEFLDQAFLVALGSATSNSDFHDPALSAQIITRQAIQKRRELIEELKNEF